MSVEQNTHSQQWESDEVKPETSTNVNTPSEGPEYQEPHGAQNSHPAGTSTDITSPTGNSNLLKRSFYFREWLLEIAGAAVAIIALIVLAVLLHHYDNQPVGNWPDGITLNSIVAIIATVARMGFSLAVGSVISQEAWVWFSPKKKHLSKIKDLEVFDEASRDAWGSVKLLWRLKTGLHLASLGALITIATVGFDTFTQQLINPVPINTLVTGPGYTAGFVPRTSVYDDYTRGSGAGQFLPTPDMQAAIYTGLFAATQSNITVSCSTGNCTWPIVPTLGVCGACSNATFTTSENEGEFNYIMPSGLNITYTDSSFSEAFAIQYVSSGSVYQMNTTDTAYLAVIDMIGLPYNSFDAPDETVTAAECALWMCVQSYNISALNGAQNQSLLDTWSTVDDSSSDNQNISFIDIPSDMNTLEEDSYSVSYFALEAIQNTFSNLYTTRTATYIGAAEWSYSDDYVQTLWEQLADPGSWISNYAGLMTNVIRQATVDQGSEVETDQGYYAGDVYASDTYVQVRWDWFIPIAVIVGVSVLYLIAGILETATSGVGNWKSSSIVPLFMTPDVSFSAAVRDDMATSSSLEDSVGNLAAKVEMSPDGGWVMRAK